MRERNCLISLTKMGRGKREGKRGEERESDAAERIEPNPRGTAAELNRTQPQGGEKRRKAYSYFINTK